VPEFIDPRFRENKPKTPVIENERFGLVFAKTVSIISGTGKETLLQSCGSGMFIPDTNFSHSGSRIQLIEFYLKILIFMLSEIPGYPSQIPARQGIPDPDPQHCFIGECTHKPIK
jgi:hypothetical protein